MSLLESSHNDKGSAWHQGAEVIVSQAWETDG